jgi:hypothetical protein
LSSISPSLMNSSPGIIVYSPGSFRGTSNRRTRNLEINHLWIPGLRLRRILE